MADLSQYTATRDQALAQLATVLGTSDRAWTVAFEPDADTLVALAPADRQATFYQAAFGRWLADLSSQIKYGLSDATVRGEFVRACAERKVVFTMSDERGGDNRDGPRAYVRVDGVLELCQRASCWSPFVFGCFNDNALPDAVRAWKKATGDCSADRAQFEAARDAALAAVATTLGGGAWQVEFEPSADAMLSSMTDEHTRDNFYRTCWGTWLTQLPEQLKYGLTDAVDRAAFVALAHARTVVFTADDSARGGRRGDGPKGYLRTDGKLELCTRTNGSPLSSCLYLRGEAMSTMLADAKKASGDVSVDREKYTKARDNALAALASELGTPPTWRTEFALDGTTTPSGDALVRAVPDDDKRERFYETVWGTWLKELPASLSYQLAKDDWLRAEFVKRASARVVVISIDGGSRGGRDGDGPNFFLHADGKIELCARANCVKPWNSADVNVGVLRKAVNELCEKDEEEARAAAAAAAAAAPPAAASVAPAVAAVVPAASGAGAAAGGGSSKLAPAPPVATTCAQAGEASAKHATARDGALRLLAKVTNSGADTWRVEFSPSPDAVHAALPAAARATMYDTVLGTWLKLLPMQFKTALKADASLVAELNTVVHTHTLVFSVDATRGGAASPTVFATVDGKLELCAQPSTLLPATRLLLSADQLRAALRGDAPVTPPAPPPASPRKQPATAAASSAAPASTPTPTSTAVTPTPTPKPTTAPTATGAIVHPSPTTPPYDHDAYTKKRDYGLAQLAVELKTSGRPWSVEFEPSVDAVALAGAKQGDCRSRFFETVYGNWLPCIPSSLRCGLQRDEWMLAEFERATSAHVIVFTVDATRGGDADDGPEPVFRADGKLEMCIKPNNIIPWNNSIDLQASRMRKAITAFVDAGGGGGGAAAATPAKSLPDGWRPGDPTFFPDSKFRLRCQTRNGHIYFISHGVLYRLCTQELWDDMMFLQPAVIANGTNDDGVPLWRSRNPMKYNRYTQSEDNRMLCAEIYKKTGKREADTMIKGQEDEEATAAPSTWQECTHCKGSGTRKNWSKGGRVEPCSWCKGKRGRMSNPSRYD